MHHETFEGVEGDEIMQVLEKILEEIKEVEKKFVIGHEVLFALGATGLASEIEEIIRNHIDHNGENTEMVDWIPVEERLPDRTGYYIVQLSRKLPNEDYSDRVVVLYNGEENEFMCYASLILAWQPLPEPYKPKKDISAAGMEHIMNRFTKIE